jgi:hypothetical protein
MKIIITPTLNVCLKGVRLRVEDLIMCLSQVLLIGMEKTKMVSTSLDVLTIGLLLPMSTKNPLGMVVAELLVVSGNLKQLT